MPAPITDSVVLAIARLVDDAQSGTREPSHSSIEFQIRKAGLLAGDPKSQGQSVGKAKRVRAVLNWAIDNDSEAGEALIESLLSLLRSCGGFRNSSPNYIGYEPIADAISVFKAEGFVLTLEGELQAQVLSSLGGAALTEALYLYVKRARRGADDAALLAGTGKDLVEATAAHILVERNGSYPQGSNFETLLGMAFVATGLKTPQHPNESGERVQCKTERALFSLALAINAMRNKQGTGHGRPWLPTITVAEATAAIQSMGVIAEWMLNAHSRRAPN